MTHIRIALPIFLAGVALTAPQVVSACHDVKFCVRWDPNLIDEGFGDSYTVGGYAYGARVTLIPPPPEQPLDTILDDSGCLAFKTQFAYGHKVLVYAEAWVGTPAVHIRAFAEGTQNAAPPPFWIVDLTGVAADDVVTHTVYKEGIAPISSLMATATNVISRLSELDVLPESDTPLSLDLVYHDWEGGAYSPSNNEIVLGINSHDSKFVIAHEIGHWLRKQWSGDLFTGSNDYGYNGPTDDNIDDADEPCRFGVNPLYDAEMNQLKTLAGKHGIRSAEHSTAAMEEGFSHFIAAAAFNDTSVSDADGIFHYYKDINVDPIGGFPLYAEFIANQSRVSLLGTDDLGGENSWVTNQCPNDWAVNGVSSEIDWMRFFWRFLTKAGTTKPTPRQILEFLYYVQDNDAIYPINASNVGCQLDLAMAFYADLYESLPRFQEANSVMGVYHGDACE